MIRRLSPGVIFCGKLGDGSEQTRSLTRLGPKCEVCEILLEVVSTELGGSPRETRAVSGQSNDFSPQSMFWWKREAGE